MTQVQDAPDTGVCRCGHTRAEHPDGVHELLRFHGNCLRCGCFGYTASPTACTPPQASGQHTRHGCLSLVVACALGALAWRTLAAYVAGLWAR